MQGIKNIKIEKEINRIIEKYQPILLLNRNTFEIKYPTENKESLAECLCNFPYLNATILYGDKLIERWKKKDDIAPYIIHEMCHLITDPLYCKSISRYVTKDEIADERELLTDYICNIVVKNKI